MDSVASSSQPEIESTRLKRLAYILTKPCSVVIKKLDDAEILHYTSFKRNLNENKPEHPKRKFSSLRNAKHLELYENYRRKRANYIKRRNKFSHSFNGHDDEISDDFETFDTSSNERMRRKKGRIRKKLAYEDDLEWSPNEPKTSKYKHYVYHQDRPRRKTHRPMVIDSDSSSESDDYLDYMDFENHKFHLSEKEGNEFRDSVNYDEQSDLALSVNNTHLNDSSTSKPQECTGTKNAHAKDVLSDIMQQMDVLNHGRKRKYGEMKIPVNEKYQDYDNYGKRAFSPKKRKSKVLHTKETSNLFTESIVRNLLDGLVRRVCINERKGLKPAEEKVAKRCCKWCKTPFSTKNATELFCVICRGDPALKNTLCNKPKKMKKVKTDTPAKTCKNMSKTMNKLLKKLPKYEKQRLMYSDKTDRCSVEKGYNHCKSFSTPKDSNSVNSNSQNTPGINIVNTGPNSSVVCTQKKIKKSLKNSHPSGIDKSLSLKKSSFKNKKTKSSKKLLGDPTELDKTILNKPTEVTADKLKKIQSKVKDTNEVSVTNVDKGLFLMTFPEPDKELDLNICMKDTFAKTDASKENKLPSNELALKEKGELEKPYVKSALTNNMQYRSLFFPTTPTILVANYASTNKRSDYFLSSIYCQSELGSNSSLLKNMLVGNNNSYSGNIQSNVLVAKQVSTMRINNNTAVFSQPCQNSTIIASSERAYATVINTNGDLGVKNMKIIQPSLLPIANTELGRSPVVYNVCSNSFTPDSSNFSNIEQDVPSIPDIFQQPAVNVSTPNDSTYSCLSNELMDNGGDMQIKIMHVTSKRILEVADSFSNNQQPNLNFTYMNTVTESEKNGGDNTEKSVIAPFSHSMNSDSVNNAYHAVDESSLNQVSVLDSVGEALLNSSKELAPNSHKEFASSLIEESGSDSSTSKESSKNSTFKDGKWEEENSNLSEPVQSNRNSETIENVNNCDMLLKEAYLEIDAISILGVIDLEKNPKLMIYLRTETIKSEIAKLLNSKLEDKDSKEKLNSLQDNYKSLQIAEDLLNKYGSFSGVSRHFVGIIKNEEPSESERQSCQFSKSSPNLLQNAVEESNSSNQTNHISRTNMKLENLSSCSLSETDISQTINHIEKIQTQINSIIQNPLSSSDTVIHPSASPHIPPHLLETAAAPASFTSRSEVMSDSRETPSRGSGPRTPARPESATSQPDDCPLTPAQIKRERLEASSSPLSQCAFSQNPSSSSLVTSNVVTPTNTSESTRFSNGANVLPSVNMNLNQIPSTMQYQNKEIPPNRTVPFNSNQNLSKVLYDFAKQQASPNIHVPVSKQNLQLSVNNVLNVQQNNVLNVQQNNVLGMQQNNLLNVQQVYLPGGAGLSQRTTVQPVPSLSANQFIIKQPQMASSSAAGGTVLVNSGAAGGQNVYPVLNNVGSQQVYTSNQVPQVYYAATAQQIANSQTQVMPSPPAYVHPNKQSPNEMVEQMFCAVCKKVAKLRCKQCAKVAYCDTNCAKTYWHQKHKMECKSMTSCP